jgi:hypothetical protein
MTPDEFDREPTFRDEHASDDAAEPLRAHAAHHRFEKTAGLSAAEPARPRGPSAQLDPESPEVLAKLEMLDDAVFAAINGVDLAFERLRTLWPAVLAELGDELVAESREQYLRYAIHIWEQLTDSLGLGNVAQAAQAAEVVCLLFEDAD